jgi:PTH1 family peptidyl-tRNA hydrolase
MIKVKSQIKLIIGLGNPGKDYENTYHNIGLLAIDYLENYQALSAKYQALKSDVYMNESGGFVKKMLKKYKIKPEELLVIHDDSDIELGKYKVSFGRGSAGHRGVESIINILGTKDFWRVRIGIGKATSNKKQETRIKAGELVLKKISRKDSEIINKVFQTITNDIS